MALQPESQFVATRTDTHVSVTDPAGHTRSIAISDITHIRVVTNDTGPVGADVWWVFDDKENGWYVAFPQGATGEDILLDWLLALPGFDHAAMTSAMGCTDNAEFPVWQRPLA